MALRELKIRALILPREESSTDDKREEDVGYVSARGDNPEQVGRIARRQNGDVTTVWNPSDIPLQETLFQAADRESTSERSSEPARCYRSGRRTMQRWLPAWCESMRFRSRPTC